jgi:hypothetical protein
MHFRLFKHEDTQEYTLIDIETDTDYMQCMIHSSSGGVMFDAIYPEDFHLLWVEVFPDRTNIELFKKLISLYYKPWQTTN